MPTATRTIPAPRVVGNGKTNTDAAVIATCNKAIALLETVRGWNNKTVAYPGDDIAWNDTQAPASRLTRKAMASKVSTLAGARAKVALLLMHHECQGNPPEKPEIELPVLRAT